MAFVAASFPTVEQSIRIQRDSSRVLSCAHPERGVISVEVDSAVAGVVEALVEALEVLESEVWDGRRISAGVNTVRVVREDGLTQEVKKAWGGGSLRAAVSQAYSRSND